MRTGHIIWILEKRYVLSIILWSSESEGLEIGIAHEKNTLVYQSMFVLHRNISVLYRQWVAWSEKKQHVDQRFLHWYRC